MPVWLYVLIAVVTALVTTGAVLAKWSWWAGARVERVDGSIADFEKRIDKLEKRVFNGSQKP